MSALTVCCKMHTHEAHVDGILLREEDLRGVGLDVQLDLILLPCLGIQTLQHTKQITSAFNDSRDFRLDYLHQGLPNFFHIKGDPQINPQKAAGPIIFLLSQGCLSERNFVCGVITVLYFSFVCISHTILYIYYYIQNIQCLPVCKLYLVHGQGIVLCQYDVHSVCGASEGNSAGMLPVLPLT